MFVEYAEDHKRHIQVPEHPYKEDNHKQGCEMAEHYLETIQKEKYLCKKTS